MFIPATEKEMKERGWDSLDIILVSGDAYIDSSYNGTAVIGHWLIDNGFRVGVIPQPSLDNDDIEHLGRPELFWGVSGGCVDSMVANYTATKKFRKEDDFTPGGVNDRRPDRACIAYTNLIRKHFKNSFIALGGIEASLRRVAHYDLWSDSVRRSILFDAKADVITYGMAELSNLTLAQCLRDKKEWIDIPGICYASSIKRSGYTDIPSYEKCKEDRDEFIKAFNIFYRSNDRRSNGIVQKHGERFLVQNPPQRIDPETLDRIYGMDFENRVHPMHSKYGKVRATDTIKQSITTHRGCYGECNFCAIAVHQGRTVISRSEDSVVREAERMASAKGFNGIIYDVGGPTANMYGIECPKKMESGECKNKRCMFPKICDSMPVDHSPQIRLLNRIENIDGVKKVFVSSGIRYDLVLADDNGKEYIDKIVKDNVSGQLKIAPEHVSEEVLHLMGKPGRNVLLKFKEEFEDSNKKFGKDQYLTYYFMAAHPGCYERHMEDLDKFIHSRLKTNPEQVQIFTPTPSTVSTMMYYTRRDQENTKDIKAEHSMQMKLKQKQILMK